METWTGSKTFNERDKNVLLFGYFVSDPQTNEGCS